MSSKTDYSLDNGENGQTTVGYPKINLCSPLRPSDNDGCSLSEWWGYDHYITCNTYQWAAVYNDSNPDLCNATPTNTPTDNPEPTGCIEKVANSQSYCICIGMDPQPITGMANGYDGRSGKLLFLNYHSNIYNVVVYFNNGATAWTQPSTDGAYTTNTTYNVNGGGQQTLPIYKNGSFDFNGYAAGLYLISYNYFCGINGTITCAILVANTVNAKIQWSGNQSVGSLMGSATLYSQDTSGTTVCSTSNQVRFVYYNISSTTNSADVNTTFYLDNGKTILAPAGAYAMANGKKYTVNSSGMVTAVAATCTVNPDMFGRYFRKTAFIMKNVAFTNITVGNCYILQNYNNPGGLYVRGIVSSYNIGAGEVTLVNYTYP